MSPVSGLATVSEVEETAGAGPASCRRTPQTGGYRRLPDITSSSSNTNTKSSQQSQSSRSFDSGICVLLSDSGSPSPPLASSQSSSSSPVPPRQADLIHQYQLQLSSLISLSLSQVASHPLQASLIPRLQPCQASEAPGLSLTETREAEPVFLPEGVAGLAFPHHCQVPPLH